MPNRPSMRVCVKPNGPYQVTGHVPLAIQVITPNDEGLSWEWVEGRTLPTEAAYELCRCGKSQNKPFCDDSHTAGFDGTETASRRPFVAQAQVITGTGVELRDAESLCAFARFCDPAGKIWGLMPETADPKARELAIREAAHCPAGRLVMRNTHTGHDLEPDLPPSIGVVQDPALGCSGPLWVRGGIPVEGADGTLYERRNRVALCRCGASANKPFCDGGHATIKFQDGLGT